MVSDDVKVTASTAYPPLDDVVTSVDAASATPIPVELVSTRTFLKGLRNDPGAAFLGLLRESPGTLASVSTDASLGLDAGQ